MNIRDFIKEQLTKFRERLLGSTLADEDYSDIMNGTGGELAFDKVRYIFIDDFIQHGEQYNPPLDDVNFWAKKNGFSNATLYLNDVIRNAKEFGSNTKYATLCYENTGETIIMDEHNLKGEFSLWRKLEEGNPVSHSASAFGLLPVETTLREMELKSIEHNSRNRWLPFVGFLDGDKSTDYSEDDPIALGVNIGKTLICITKFEEDEA